MVLPIPPNNPNIPIPNNPFYSPETNYIKGEYGPFIVGSGLSVDNATGVISSSGGGGGGVTALTAGPGIAVSAATGNVTVSTSFLVSGTYPIQVTNGSSNPVISIAPATITGPGAVQLDNTLSSTSTTLALTAAQGKALQDQITALTTSPGINLAGTIDASSGLVTSVTSAGTSAGYVQGDPLDPASATNKNTYVIVTSPGTLTPPGGVATPATRGDWFLSSEVSTGVYAWQFLNVGFDAPAASTTAAGIVELATNAETVTGTDATTAVTPAGAACAYIAKSALTAKGALISATAASTPSALAVGPDGCVLTACAAAPTGLCWTSAPAAGIPCACLAAKGSLVTATAASTPANLNVGSDGQALVACSTCSSGLTWASISVVNATPTVAGIVKGCTDATNAALGCNALVNNTGSSNVAVGLQALCSNVTGSQNVAVGANALFNAASNGNTGVGNFALYGVTNGASNTAIGSGAAKALVSGSFTTAVGFDALCSVLAGTTNTALGALAGKNVTSGGLNVIIGANVDVPSPTGSCQLAIGYDGSQYWLTGDSNKHIQPGAGVRDCAGSLGTAGQVLCSTGSAIQWASVTSSDWVSAGTIQSVGLTSTGGTTPVPPAVVIRNNVTYRPVGGKIWQVAYMYAASTAFTNAGNGDWLFTLPNGLQFNTSLSSQPLFTGSVNANNHANRQYFIPGPSSVQVAFNDGSNGAQYGAGVVVYSATQFRIFATDAGNGGPGPVRSNYWGNGVGLTFSVGFQLATP